MNAWTAPWSNVMQLETKYVRLCTAVTLGSQLGDSSTDKLWPVVTNSPSRGLATCLTQITVDLLCRLTSHLQRGWPVIVNHEVGVNGCVFRNAQLR